MHPSLRALAETQLGVFTAADARHAGYGQPEIRRLVASRRWVRLRRGIFAAAEDLADLDREGRRYRAEFCAVLLALDRPTAVLSHASAARLWGLPRPRGLPGVVRLTDPHLWRRGQGFVVAQAPLGPGDRATSGPLRLTSAARTLVDCAREWPLEDAVVAMDAGLWAERTTTDRLQAALETARRWPGASQAARAVSLASGRAASPLETRGRLRILGAGFPSPELQMEVHADGRRLAVVDAWFDDAAVAVEFDGKVKYLDPWRDPQQVLWEEKRREDALRDLDIRILRIVDDDLDRRWPHVEARLRHLLSTPGPAVRQFTVRPARGADGVPPDHPPPPPRGAGGVTAQ